MNEELEVKEPEVKVVEKIVEVEKVVEKIVEVEKECVVGVNLSREEAKGLLSHLPTLSERPHVQSAKEKLLKFLEK